MSPRRVEVTGETIPIACPDAGNSPVLRARIRASEGEFVLVFPGRTVVRCIEVGSRLTVRGAVSGRDAVPTIFDPAYTVLLSERRPQSRRRPRLRKSAAATESTKPAEQR